MVSKRKYRKRNIKMYKEKKYKKILFFGFCF